MLQYLYCFNERNVFQTDLNEWPTNLTGLEACDENGGLNYANTPRFPVCLFQTLSGGCWDYWIDPTQEVGNIPDVRDYSSLVAHYSPS